MRSPSTSRRSALSWSACATDSWATRLPGPRTSRRSASRHVRRSPVQPCRSTCRCATRAGTAAAAARPGPNAVRGCSGSGECSRSHQVRVLVPAGVTDGTRFRFLHRDAAWRTDAHRGDGARGLTAVPTHSRGSRFDRHIEFLGLLHQLWAAFNAILGVALGLFAVSAALLAVAPDRRPGSEIAAVVTAAGFTIVAATAVVWAIVHAWCGGALRRRDPWSRVLALALALLNALLFPLGTVLAFYTLWVLLQEDVRVRFGPLTVDCSAAGGGCCRWAAKRPRRSGVSPLTSSRPRQLTVNGSTKRREVNRAVLRPRAAPCHALERQPRARRQSTCAQHRLGVVAARRREAAAHAEGGHQRRGGPLVQVHGRHGRGGGPLRARAADSCRACRRPAQDEHQTAREKPAAREHRQVRKHETPAGDGVPVPACHIQVRRRVRSARRTR